MNRISQIRRQRKETTRMITDNREYRNFRSFEIRKAEDAEEGQEKKYLVTGYASTFEPYTLMSIDGIDYKEQVDPHAFDEADMSDVIFLYNHQGMVYARNKNGTLELGVDDHGFQVEADLGSTTQSRELHEAIDTGLIDQMSFAFTVKEDSYDRETHTRTIRKFKKIYDVSAVSIPANPGTDIAAVSARSWLDGVIEAEKAERLEHEQRLAVAKAKYRYFEV